jgi:ketosteroid isomerase-like protein
MNPITSHWTYRCAQGVTLAAALVSAPLVAQASAEEQAVASVVEKLRAAMVDPDQAVLKELTSPLLSYGHSGGKVDTQTSFIAALLDGSSDFVSITLSDQTVSVSGNVAVVRHTLAGATNDNGKAGNVTIKVLTVWQKDGGQWRLLARQAVRPAA